MAILNLHVVIALVVAAFTVSVVSDECPQSGTFSFNSHFVPEKGEKRPVEIVYELDGGRMAPNLKVVCPHDSAECPSSGTFVYNATYIDPTAISKATAVVIFELRDEGLLNPNVKATCYNGSTKVVCPASAVYSNVAYRIDPKTNGKTQVIASYGFKDGVYGYIVAISCLK